MVQIFLTFVIPFSSYLFFVFIPVQLKLSNMSRFIFNLIRI